MAAFSENSMLNRHNSQLAHWPALNRHCKGNYTDEENTKLLAAGFVARRSTIYVAALPRGATTIKGPYAFFKTFEKCILSLYFTEGKNMNRLSIIAATAIFAANAVQAIDFEPSTMTIPASSILESNLLKGELYTIADTVTIDGYMHHYIVDSDFGQFAVVGDRALKKLLHEIEVIAELKKMTSVGIGTDAAVSAVTDTGKSLVNLATSPVDSVKGVSAGVSRFFKRTSRKTKTIGGEVTETANGAVSKDKNTESGKTSEEDDEPGMTTQLASSFMGVGKAHRELARELKVDPYSNNAILQAELNRVAQISGSVGKITNILIPVPSVVGLAANVSDMVWSLSPMDLLIQNEERLKVLGYTEELINAFFSNKLFSPTQQTAFVAALESLDKAKGREVLLKIANSVESQVEGEFVVRAAFFAQLYHENVEPVTEFASAPNDLHPVAFTKNGDGLVIAPMDHLLWTKEIASATARLSKLIDDHGAAGEHLIWIKGRVSDMAQAQLSANDWVRSTEGFQKLDLMIRD